MEVTLGQETGVRLSTLADRYLMASRKIVVGDTAGVGMYGQWERREEARKMDASAALLLSHRACACSLHPSPPESKDDFSTQLSAMIFLTN